MIRLLQTGAQYKAGNAPDETDLDISRIQILMSEALGESLQRVLGGSDIEHAACSLRYLSDEALKAALSVAKREGLSLRRLA